MSFLVYDTTREETETCGAIQDAIARVESRLQAEESRGSKVEREDKGRWAIYRAETIDLVWIEDTQGSVVSFAR